MARKIFGALVLWFALVLGGCGGATSDTPTTSRDEGTGQATDSPAADGGFESASAEPSTDPETTEEVIETADPLD